MEGLLSFFGGKKRRRANLIASFVVYIKSWQQ